MITIAILVKNGAKYLDEVLKAVKEHGSRFTYEVIAIDSGSKDGSLDILKYHGIRLIEIAPEEFNHGQTRDLACRAANDQSKYMVYLSQDATPMGGWLDALIEPMEADSEIAGTFSRQIPRPEASPIVKYLMQHRWEQVGTDKRVLKHIEKIDDFKLRMLWYCSFSNTSSCIRRQLLLEHPFGNAGFAEDALWAKMMLIKGYKILYEPASRVLHSHDHSLFEVLSASFDHGRGMTEVAQNGNIKADARLNRRNLLEMVNMIKEECSYILKDDSSIPRKLCYLLYMPFWHSIARLGSLLGYKHQSLPEALKRWLSRQERLRSE